MDRVQKLISEAGLMSRRKAEDAIREGRVKVNGKLIGIGDKATKKDKITVDGKALEYPDKVYLMLNKPKGYLVSLSDPSGKKTITEFLKNDKRVFPIGRLDYNSRGLLLLTNDGDFANMIMHPSHEVEKTYLVKLHKTPKIRDLFKIKNGIMIEDRITKGKVSHMDNDVEITIHEGRNRIVRKIFDALGYKVLDLVRVRIGGVSLDIPEGKVRRLNKRELETLRGK